MSRQKHQSVWDQYVIVKAKAGDKNKQIIDNLDTNKDRNQKETSCWDFSTPVFNAGALGHCCLDLMGKGPKDCDVVNQSDT